MRKRPAFIRVISGEFPALEKKILEILRQTQGGYTSGQAISELLDVSRTAVWKAIKSLRQKGFDIESGAGSGYRLKAGPDKIVGVDIEAALGTKIVGKSVVSFDSTPSTIDAASKLAQEGAREGTVVVAEAQSGGRGRLGRKWSSPGGVGIWTSIILRPLIPPRDAPKLTLLAAVSVATVLRDQYGIDALIKWPNDVIVGNRKICGALTELMAEQDAVKYLITSFGLNVNQTRSKFPAEVRDIATSMRIESGKKLDRPEVFRCVLREFDGHYSHFRNHGSDDILDHWRRLSGTLGNRVMIQLRDEQIEGVAIDVDDDGSLIVDLGDGTTRSIAYGDVTILRKAASQDEA
jgi:BirA family biotin operon repressor/biotin-[acetyl-CoA-carboxylase] ligase